MNLTLTAKLKIKPTSLQAMLLHKTMAAYRKGCNMVSKLIFERTALNARSLHKLTYTHLRQQFGLRSQMAQSVLKTVLARYKTNESSGHDRTHVQFKRPEYDLVWNRDYSLAAGVFSLNTLEGRVKVVFESKGMEHFFDGSWRFGTAKLVHKHSKWFLHIPMTKEIDEIEDKDLGQVIGIDMGVNFVATAYDSAGKTTFFSGRRIKDKRARYKQLRKALQMRQTPSARRRLKKIGQRENRWMTDVNHQVSKALISRYGAKTLFVLEDLQGVRKRAERVCRNSRYVTVSWAYYQLRQMITYKAVMAGSKTIAVNPKYTSQTCPKCNHIAKGNRNKKKHLFCCRACGYRSNDDRIASMNLWQSGNKYIAKDAT